MLAGAYRVSTTILKGNQAMREATILIADDDRQFRAALRTRLTNMGFSVAEAVDGVGLLNQCPTGWVDAIILDQEMPNGDGMATAQVIRRETNVPIIFLSGRDRSHFLDIVSRLPDVYYLPKPLDSEKLKGLLECVLRPKASAPPACADATHGIAADVH